MSEGAYVFITGRREPELAAAVNQIGRHVIGVRGDVSNLGDLERLFAMVDDNVRTIVEGMEFPWRDEDEHLVVLLEACGKQNK